MPTNPANKEKNADNLSTLYIGISNRVKKGHKVRMVKIGTFISNAILLDNIILSQIAITIKAIQISIYGRNMERVAMSIHILIIVSPIYYSVIHCL